MALAGSSARIRACAWALGFTLEAKPMEFGRGTVRIERISKVMPGEEDVLMLDVLSVPPEVESQIVVESLDWEGCQLQTVDKASLVRLKMLRGSAQDLADVEKLA